jgi:hypothetical protein
MFSLPGHLAQCLHFGQAQDNSNPLGGTMLLLLASSSAGAYIWNMPAHEELSPSETTREQIPSAELEVLATEIAEALRIWHRTSYVDSVSLQRERAREFNNTVNNLKKLIDFSQLSRGKLSLTVGRESARGWEFQKGPYDQDYGHSLTFEPGKEVLLNTTKIATGRERHSERPVPAEFYPQAELYAGDYKSGAMISVSSLARTLTEDGQLRIVDSEAD